MVKESLTSRAILRFWAPLAGTWLMMALEGPFIAAIIARLPDARENLAAYGVAFAFGLILESPAVMLLSAATVLAENRESYLTLRRFGYGLCGLLTVVVVVVVFPPVFNWLAGSLLNLPTAIRPLVHQALVLLLPWPAAIGYRRFKQGLLIRHGLTRHVAFGALVRLTAMAATAGVLVLFTSMRGASVGTFALSTGVIAEAIMSGRMARRAVRALESGDAGSKRQLTMRQTVVFYIPLALTAMLAMGTQPMVTFMMGQSRMVVESLAVFPVISGLTFMFRSLGLSFQEVGVALLGPRMKHLRPLCKFGVLLALVSSSCLAVVAHTPLAIIWFRDVSGLSLALTEFAISPLRLMVLLPALSVVLSLQRSILLTTRRTTLITLASSVEIITIAGFLWIGIHVFDAVGIMSAAVALVIGRLLTNLWLARPCWRAKVLA
ncbi:MAG: hypothetical protein QF507_07215 [Vicinamibacterales bacterium]|jgi:hypothetical protein|nr:hypothetical protein [Vicinamibacterales bacterium]HJO18540.1 hypothetical protein [Vicinamibacterales bacterium]|tara:strand:- start:985 stop:2289 length:1305 start_codon:yes stop_codon:yes gene_type:complete